MAARYVTTLLTAFDGYADRPALAFRGDELSFGETRDAVYRVARALRTFGVVRGAGVTCITSNRLEVLLIRLASHVLGARLTLVVIDSATHGIEHILRDAEPTVVIADIPLPIAATAHLVPLKNLMEASAGQPSDPVEVAAREDDIARVSYTSGTTGVPKGVASSFSAMHARTHWRHKNASPGNLTFLSVTSLAQRAGGRCLEHLLSGGRVEILESFSPEAVATVCERLSPIATYLIPHQIYELLDHPRTGHGIPGLVSVSYGASRIAPTRLHEALTRLGTDNFRQGYGMHETAVISRLSPEDHRAALYDKPHLLASAGRPVVGVTVEIQQEDGTPLPSGHVGEVCVRSPAMMSGYWRRPDLTAQVMRAGWLHTGDLGRVDDEDYLYLVDRITDMIIVKGENCYTAPIEAVLARHPAIATAAVVGYERQPTSEEIHAFLVPSVEHAGSAAIAAEACRWVADELAPAHVPAVVHWIVKLPLVASGKPDKRQLRAGITHRDARR